VLVLMKKLLTWPMPLNLGWLPTSTAAILAAFGGLPRRWNTVWSVLIRAYCPMLQHRLVALNSLAWVVKVLIRVWMTTWLQSICAWVGFNKERLMSHAPRIALIHALTDSQVPAWQAFEAYWPEADIHNVLDDSLAMDLAAEG